VVMIVVVVVVVVTKLKEVLRAKTLKKLWKPNKK
jgi:hypothetical protein